MLKEVWTRDYISPTGDENMNFTALRKLSYNPAGMVTFTKDEAHAVIKSSSKFSEEDYEFDNRGNLTISQPEVEELLKDAGYTLRSTTTD